MTITTYLLDSLRAYPRSIKEAMFIYLIIDPTPKNLYLFLSMLGNNQLSYLLKNISKKYIETHKSVIARPEGAKYCTSFIPSPKYNQEYFTNNGVGQHSLTSIGMPSGHTMFAFFISTYAILKIWNETKITNQWIKWGSTILLASIAFAVGISRSSYYENCHTKEQIIFGMLIGIIYGIIIYIGEMYLFNKI